jgi:hypothetical protein
MQDQILHIAAFLHHVMTCRLSTGDNFLLTTHTSLSPIRRGYHARLCKLQKGCTRLAAAIDKVYQLLARGHWFSPASSTTKTGRHDIAESGVKTPKIKSNQFNLPTHHLRQFGHQGSDFINPSIFIGATLNLYICINMMINTNYT